MSEQKKAADKYPHQVWAIDGAIAGGYDTPEEATANADYRDSEAEKLGIQTRYETREK